MEKKKGMQDLKHVGNGNKKGDSPFDDTIEDENEVVRDFSLKVLGVIPLLGDKDRTQGLEKVVHVDPESTTSEAFRGITTTILSTPFDLPSKCLLVTSTQACEGKTTTASNLALSLVESGLQVILVDTNLREPNLHDVFLNGDNAHGLSTYLAEKNKPLTRISKHTNTEGLDIIAAGPIPPNPLELFSSDNMKRLLNTLRNKYDYVILDGPPIMGFDDLWPLSRLVDGILLVTSVGITRRQDLSASIDEIINKQRKILGAIVNRLEPKRSADEHPVSQGDINDQDVRIEEIRDPDTETAAMEFTTPETHEKNARRFNLQTAKRIILPMLLGIAVMIVVNYILVNSDEKRNELAKKKIDEVGQAIEAPFLPSREGAVFTSGAEVEKQSSSDSGLTMKSENILARPVKQPRDSIAEMQAEKEPVQEKKNKAGLQILKEKTTIKPKKQINLATLPAGKMEAFRPASEQQAKQAAESETKEQREPTIEDVYKLATEIHKTLR